MLLAVRFVSDSADEEADMSPAQRRLGDAALGRRRRTAAMSSRRSST